MASGTAIIAIDTITVAIFLLGVVSTVLVSLATARDARRTGVERPRLWACVTGGTIALGFSLHLFATVPLTGVILTANTGPVLYGFEREIAGEDSNRSEPGTIPSDAVDNDSSAVDSRH